MQCRITAVGCSRPLHPSASQCAGLPCGPPLRRRTRSIAIAHTRLGTGPLPKQALTYDSGVLSAVQPSWQASAISTYLKTATGLPDAKLFNATGRGFPDVAAQVRKRNRNANGRSFAVAHSEHRRPASLGRKAFALTVLTLGLVTQHCCGSATAFGCTGRQLRRGQWRHPAPRRFGHLRCETKAKRITSHCITSLRP